ncbi:hypothetical protein GGR54DRAFT_649629 [Hypoxylon sp. NC1633]|nr:hypothetical protein GGR54DRAFT_649629 [Hypoxylon sp. NC1633]
MNSDKSCAGCVSRGVVCELSLAIDPLNTDNRCNECIEAGEGCMIPTDDRKLLQSGVKTATPTELPGHRKCLKCAVAGSMCHFSKGFRPYPCIACVVSEATGCLIPPPPPPPVNLLQGPADFYGIPQDFVGNQEFNSAFAGSAELHQMTHQMPLFDQAALVTPHGPPFEQPVQPSPLLNAEYAANLHQLDDQWAIPSHLDPQVSSNEPPPAQPQQDDFALGDFDEFFNTCVDWTNGEHISADTPVADTPVPEPQAELRMEHTYFKREEADPTMETDAVVCTPSEVASEEAVFEDVPIPYEYPWDVDVNLEDMESQFLS